MKKYLLLLTIFICFISIKNVNAANTYTRIDGGRNYYYCQDGNCNTISADSVTSNGNTITIDGTEYTFDSGLTFTNSGQTSSLGDKSPCVKLKSPLKFLGYILLIVKIIIPLLLIVFGIIDLFKAVTGGKDGEITKSLKSFIFRLIGGVAIFFVPTIISFVFSLVDGFDQVESDYNLCQKCILNVSECN